jgi:hypothetical protein
MSATRGPDKTVILFDYEPVRSHAVRWDFKVFKRQLTFSALQTNQVKDPGTFNQITRSKPPRIRQKTVQPFEASLLNPNRRATLFSGEKVDRSAYT